MAQVKIDSAGAVVTVEATGYSVIVRGMPPDAELSSGEADRLAEALRDASSV